MELQKSTLKGSGLLSFFFLLLGMKLQCWKWKPRSNVYEAMLSRKTEKGKKKKDRRNWVSEGHCVVSCPGMTFEVVIRKENSKPH